MPDNIFLTCDCRSFSSDLERDLAAYMIRAMKFEHYLCKTHKFRKMDKRNGIKLIGVEWNVVAAQIEKKQPFANYLFDVCSFKYLKENPPGYLIRNDNNDLKWEATGAIESWERLLKMGLAQLRNNIAHGSKAVSSETRDPDRLKKLLKSGDELMDFIAKVLNENKDWQNEIGFLE